MFEANTYQIPCFIVRALAAPLTNDLALDDVPALLRIAVQGDAADIPKDQRDWALSCLAAGRVIPKRGPSNQTADHPIQVEQAFDPVQRDSNVTDENFDAHLQGLVNAKLQRPVKIPAAQMRQIREACGTRLEAAEALVYILEQREERDGTIKSVIGYMLTVLRGIASPQEIIDQASALLDVGLDSSIIDKDLRAVRAKMETEAPDLALNYAAIEADRAYLASRKEGNAG